ncbi:hypothetical protein JIG36_06555 [Actinoplanes sp. LDG1-06]|uniref:Uncharacterized protein n=1 Tax=Paractinoplanes ovalisporus TaxID=2810368 RepID=A0ABS2A5V6_9ACTN|nr:hypothetical protein [Actinoplanes ovalisporus]MBM2615223.1 hypothetical protein [Actinoplanes ovalisporus]
MPRRLLSITVNVCIATALAIVINLITSGWNWWLTVALVLLLALSVAAPLLADRVPATPPPTASYSIEPRRYLGLLYDRGALLKDIRDDLVARAAAAPPAPGPVLVLHGIDGVGTSAVAYAITTQAEQHGIKVWRVDGEQPETFHGCLNDLRLSLVGSRGEGGYSDRANELWDALNGYGRPWLLVVDNVDDLRVLGDKQLTRWIRRPPGNSTVLVTTADGGARRIPSAETREISCLSPAAGGRLLLDVVPEAGDAREAELLSERLGGHTLSLTLAGDYLRATAGRTGTPMTFRAYRRGLRRRRPWDALLAMVMPEESRKLREAWDRSLDVIEAELPGSRMFLGVLCNVTTVAIPRVLLDPGKLTGSGLVAKTFPVDRALGRLADFGLLHLDGDGDKQLITVHPVIQQLNRNQAEARRQAGPIRRLVRVLKDFPERLAPPALRPAVRWATAIEVPPRKQSRPTWLGRLNERFGGPDPDDPGMTVRPPRPKPRPTGPTGGARTVVVTEPEPRRTPAYEYEYEYGYSELDDLPVRRL